MRSHNGIILVTEPVAVLEVALAAEQALPSLPTGDLGRDMKQVTLRSTNNAWEYGWESLGSGRFWMAGGDILVLSQRDMAQIQDFRFNAAGAACDMRIIYEC